MALNLTHPEDRAPFTDEAFARMARGTDLEDAILARLKRIGPQLPTPFRIVGEQVRFEVKDRDGLLLGSGKIDCRIEIGGQTPVAEVKSGRTVEHLRTAEDFHRSSVWSRKYLDQLLNYLLAANEPWGVFIIARGGMPKVVPVVLEDWLERAERNLTGMRQAVDHAADKGPIPDFTDDRSLCRTCDHLGRSCAPVGLDAAGWAVINDEELIALAEVRERTEAAAKDHDAADARLKEALRGVEFGLLGPYEVSGKWSKSTTYDVPPLIKQQYKVENPQGRFLLKIERVVPETKAVDGAAPSA
jgi:hypothetical protein